METRSGSAALPPRALNPPLCKCGAVAAADRLPRVSDREPRGPVALVLAGGGARGAYEAGALSVLLPLLEKRGERPRILIGTSVGALNVSFLAANAHLPTDELIASTFAISSS